MKQLNLGTLKMPITSATRTFGILAKRGAGKTYTGGVMAEEFFKNDIPFVVFDPIDVWYGLKLNKDGKSKGLPIVVFGVEHADIKLDRDMGRRIAQAVVKHNISCVISTFGMPKVAQRHLIAEFSEELLNINNTPRHIFIEEAHEFVPQRVFGAMGRTFNAVSNLIVMGRNRGIGVTLLNQRASTINKDVLTQIDTLLAFRNIAPQDRKALREWVECHSAEGDFDKFMKSLPSLPTGEGWAWSPEFLQVFERIKIRERETFHQDREKIGNTFVIPQFEQGDIQEFIKDFQKPEPKETPVTEKEIRELEKKVAGYKKLPAGSVVLVDDETHKEIHGKSSAILEMNYRLMEGAIEKLGKENALLKSQMTALMGFEKKYKRLLKIAKAFAETLKEFEDIEGKVIITDEAHVPTPSFSPSSLYAGNMAHKGIIIENLPKYEGEIMTAIMKHPNIPFSRSQLALVSGKSVKSSAFDSAVARLKKLGLIEYDGKGDIYFRG
jgi:hypothetical protein